MEITGEKMNRGTGLGVEAPCVYRLYGPIAYIERTKQLSSKQLDRDCHLFTSVVVRNTTAPNVLCQCVVRVKKYGRNTE